MSDTSEMTSTRPSPTAGHPTAATQFALSRDGTRIAYTRAGRGPALILVDGALCHRSMGPSAELSRLLAGDFTVFTYDRRGRNESGDTPPYAPEREVEDIEALLEAAGGDAFLWGTSSGALLAIAAASRLKGIRKLAVYEAPLIVDSTRKGTEGDWAKIRAAVSAGRRGDAVKAFLTSVGVPRLVLSIMRFTPVWKTLKAVAHTLPYDGAIVGANQRGKPLTAGPWDSLALPTLVMDGGASPAWMRHGNSALAHAIPNARYETLPKQTHMLKAAAHAPVLVKFFKG